MTTDKVPMGERYFSDLIEIERLLTRVDERVQSIIKFQEHLDVKINDQHDMIGGLNTKISIIESNDVSDSNQASLHKIRNDLHLMELKIQLLESSTSSTEGRWKTIIGFGIQLVWVILAAFLLYKLGISSPPVP